MKNLATPIVTNDSDLELVDFKLSPNRRIGKVVFKDVEREGLFETGTFLKEDKSRHDICVSSMAGCNMGCKMCAIPYSEKPFERRLDAGELVEQVRFAINARAADINGEVVNSVGFMGNGEPFGNFDSMMQAISELDESDDLIDHVSISTMGINLQLLTRLADAQRGLRLPLNLQYSLITLLSDLRKRLIPLTTPLADAITALDSYSEKVGSPVKYNIPLIKGINNREDDLRGLLQFAKEKPQARRMKLSTFNPFPGVPYKPVSDEGVDRAAELLRSEGLNIQVFKGDRDDDVFASCGQLRNHIHCEK